MEENQSSFNNFWYYGIFSGFTFTAMFKFIIWGVVIYLIYKFVFELIVPVSKAATQMQDKLKQMQEMQQRHTQQQQAQEPVTKAKPHPAAMIISITKRWNNFFPYKFRSNTVIGGAKCTICNPVLAAASTLINVSSINNVSAGFNFCSSMILWKEAVSGLRIPISCE